MPVRIQVDEKRLRNLIEVQTLTQHEAAKELGVSEDTVLRRCKELGLKTQRTGPRSGERHPDWKGGRRYVGGYVYIYRPDHPHATKQGYVCEHRLVMEKKLGRFLHPMEVVHHLNDIPDDNRAENLGLFASNKEHLQATLQGKCPRWTPEGMERIRKGLIKRANQIRQGIGVPPRNQRGNRFVARRDKSSPQA